MARYTIKVYGRGLVFTERDDHRLTLEVKDLPWLREEMGERVLVAFLRCFVWADRITSIWHFHHWNTTNLPETSVAFARNLQTLVWQTAGALREAALAINGLNKAGIKGILTNPVHWDELRAMAKRWDTTKRLVDIRNKVGFHVDPATIAAGVEEASRMDQRLIVTAGDSIKGITVSRRLGLELLLSGTGMTLSEFDDLMKTIVDDSNRFGDLVELVFWDTLASLGIMR